MQAVDAEVGDINRRDATRANVFAQPDQRCIGPIGVKAFVLAQQLCNTREPRGIWVMNANYASGRQVSKRSTQPSRQEKRGFVEHRLDAVQLPPKRREPSARPAVQRIIEVVQRDEYAGVQQHIGPHTGGWRSTCHEAVQPPATRRRTAILSAG